MLFIVISGIRISIMLQLNNNNNNKNKVLYQNLSFTVKLGNI